MLEQGGLATGTGAYGLKTVNLLRTFASQQYYVNAFIDWRTNAGTDSWFTSTNAMGCTAVSDITGYITDRSTTYFRMQSCSNHMWMACGYAL